VGVGEHLCVELVDVYFDVRVILLQGVESCEVVGVSVGEYDGEGF